VAHVRRICLLALSALALLLPFAGSAQAAPVPSEFYGVNMPLLFSWPTGQWGPHLNAASGTRVGVVRSDADWWGAEPTAPVAGVHTYDWTSFDQRISAMAARRLRWYPVMAFSTPWSGVLGHDKSPPRSTADYTAYVRAFARRYGRGGSFWRDHPSLPQLPVTTYEIWNEQNHPVFWTPQDGSAERYADLFMSARAALKSVDPAARVVIGGLSNVPTVTRDTAFLRRMYAHRGDLRGRVDAVAFHPYSGRVEGVYSEIRRMRETLADLGEGGVPLEITEVGWTTTRTPEAERAYDLARIVRDLPRSDCNVTRLIPYSWITREQNGSDDEHWFGIYNFNATPKPSGAAFGQAVRQMTSAPAGGTVSICGGAGDRRGGASSRPRLRLRVRVRGSVRRGLRIRARCSTPCRLRVQLVSRRRGRKTRRLVTRRLRREVRRHRLRIRGSRRLAIKARGRVRIKVMASAGGGRFTAVRRARRR
jgi:hypothetical protein